jgi:predicted RND superfamily exporter protein
MKKRKNQQTRNPLAAIAGASSSHPWATLLVTLAITALFLVPASHLTIDSSVEGAFGDDVPEDMERFEHIAASFGEQEMVTVVVDCTGSNGSVARQFLQELASMLEDSDWFTNVRYTRSLAFAGEKAILYLPVEQLGFLTDPNATAESITATYNAMMAEMQKPSYMVSDDGTLYLLNMMLNVTIDSAEIRTTVFDGLNQMLDDTQQQEPAYGQLDVGFTGGMMVLDYEGDQMAMQDMLITAVITFVAILILLFISFRSISLPLLSLIPLLCGIIITAGLIGIFFGALSMATAIFAALLLGLGIDFSIHLLTRFTEEMEARDDVSRAFVHTARHTGTAILLGALTTATAFGVLYFSTTQALHELGIILALGLMVTMLCVFMVLPALTALRLRTGSLREKMTRRSRFQVLRSIGSAVTRHAGVMAVLLLVVAGVFAVSAPRAEIETDFTELMPTDVPAYRQLEKVKSAFNYTEDNILCVASNDSELMRSVRGFREISEVMRVESVLDYLPANQSEKLAVIARAKQLHPELAGEAWLNVSGMSWQDLPDDIREEWTAGDDHGGTRFLIRIQARGDIWSEGYRQALVEKLRMVNDNIAARAIYIPELVDVMTRDVIRVSLFAAVPIIGIVYLGFRRRSPVYALLAVVPVLLGVGGILGLSQFLGISLNMMSIMMIPLVIGIGIDSGIHILHRYKEEGPGSLPRVVQHTGKAVFLTTATTTLAFSSFLFAAHPGLRSMGETPAVGLVLCFLAAILFLPALMRLLLERRPA